MSRDLSGVAVVILNYNGVSYLQQFLDGVKQHSGNARIIVADNASTDKSRQWLQAHHADVECIHLLENYGFAGGYNQALAQVEAQYYVLLNSDVDVTASWLDSLIDCLETNPTRAAVQPKIRSYADRHLFEHAGASGGWLDAWGYPFCRGRLLAHLEEDTGQYDDTQEVFWATGAALCIRADLYHAFGGLDADFFAHMEEIDLCWRLKRAGYSIHVAPESTVFHVGGGTLPVESPRKVYLNFRNNHIMLLKNERFSKLLWLWLWRLDLDGLAGVLFLSEGKFAHVWAIVRAHWAVFFSIFSIIKKRRKTKATIERNRIGLSNPNGRFSGSLIIRYYLKKVRHFSDLIEK